MACASSRLEVGELECVLLLSYGRVGKDREKGSGNWVKRNGIVIMPVTDIVSGI